MTDQRPTRTLVPANRQHSQEKSNRAHGGIRTKNPSLRARFAYVAEVQRERWRPLTALLLKILENVSSNGSSAGIAASSRTGVLCRGLKFQNFTNILNIFLTIPGIFWSPLV